MAFNWQTFRTRALTAILFVIVMLAGLLLNVWGFLVLFSIIHFGCWWEYLRIIEKIHNVKFHPYVKLGFMVLGYGLMLSFCGNIFQINGFGLKENVSLPVSIAGFILLILGIFRPVKIDLKSFSGAFLGLLYISLSWGLLINLRSSTGLFLLSAMRRLSPGELPNLDIGKLSMYSLVNLVVCLTVILTMWVNDTMAYLVGSLIGKRPLTKISPKKTWEGTIGGILLAVILLGLIFSYYFPTDFFRVPTHFWFSLTGIAAIAGTFGDLLESKLKRMAEIKDSGHIMPGHGGFLDRFDSLLLAIPFAWLFVLVIFMKS